MGLYDVFNSAWFVVKPNVNHASEGRPPLVSEIYDP